MCNRHNRLFVWDSDYITFWHDYAGCMFYRDCDSIMNAISVKLRDYDYFVNKINDYDYVDDYSVFAIDYNLLQLLN